MRYDLKILKNTTEKKISLDRMKRRLYLITMRKEECVKCTSDVEVLNTRLSLNRRKQHKATYKGSGIVVLMIAIKGTKISPEIQNNRVKWATLIIECVNITR